MTIKTDIDQLVADAQKVHNWAHGSATHTEAFGNQQVRSPAKLISDKDAEINAAANGVLAQAIFQAGMASNSAAEATTKALEAAINKELAAAAWTAALAANPDLNPAIRMNPSAIHTDTTIPAGYNAVSVGPIEIATSTHFTVSQGAHWTVI